MRSVSLAVVLVLTLGGLLGPASAEAPRAADRATAVALQGDQPKCKKSAKKVASKKVRAHGRYYGKVVITRSTQQQGDFSYVICGVTKVAKKYRKHEHVVRQTFRHFSSDGGKLGEVRGDTYADKAKPLLFGSSFVPEGDRYVFKARIEAGRNASGKVSFKVPS